MTHGAVAVVHILPAATAAAAAATPAAALLSRSLMCCVLLPIFFSDGVLCRSPWTGCWRIHPHAAFVCAQICPSVLLFFT